MGDRVLVTTREEYEKKNGEGICIYLHWGGDVIFDYLEDASQMGYRSFKTDHSYALARLMGFLADRCDIRSNTGIGIGHLKEYCIEATDRGLIILNEWNDYDVVRPTWWRPGLEVEE